MQNTLVKVSNIAAHHAHTEQLANLEYQLKLINDTFNHHRKLSNPTWNDVNMLEQYNQLLQQVIDFSN